MFIFVLSLLIHENILKGAYETTTFFNKEKD